jgi:hypothetical protein
MPSSETIPRLLCARGMCIAILMNSCPLAYTFCVTSSHRLRQARGLFQSGQIVFLSEFQDSPPYRASGSSQHGPSSSATVSSIHSAGASSPASRAFELAPAFHQSCQKAACALHGWHLGMMALVQAAWLPAPCTMLRATGVFHLANL